MNDPRFKLSHLSQTIDHNLKDPVRQNASESCSDQEFLQFRPNSQNDDSGACSPPLWKNSPSPPRSPSQPLLSHHVYRSLSSAARMQAIARGQKELMEMVKNMPESSYELSLKDLVEHTRIEAKTTPLDGRNLVKRLESKKSEKKLVRNGSFEHGNKGLLLNMVFPFSLNSKKRRNLDRSFSGRVAPKTEAAKGGGGGGEWDWWKKKFSGSSDSDSSRVSNNSSAGGGSSSRSSSGGSSSCRNHGDGGEKNSLLTSCWPLFRSKDNKSVE